MWPAIYPRLMELIPRPHDLDRVRQPQACASGSPQRLNDLAAKSWCAHHGSLAHAAPRDGGSRVGGLIVATTRSSSASTWARSISWCWSSRRGRSPACSAWGGRVTASARSARGGCSPSIAAILEAAVVARRDEGHSGAAKPAVACWPTDRAIGRAATGRCTALARPAAASHELFEPIRACSTCCRVTPCKAFRQCAPAPGVGPGGARPPDPPGAARALLALVNGGTIPDRGTYGVRLGEGRRAGGQSSTRRWSTTRARQRVHLAPAAGSTSASRNQVIVSPAPADRGKLPFWRGDGPRQPIETRPRNRRVHARANRGLDAKATAWLRERYRLDEPRGRQPDRLRDRAARAHRHGAHRPGNHRRAVPRRAGRLARCILSPLGAKYTRRGRWRSRPLSRRAGFKSRPCGATTASWCASPTPPSCPTPKCWSPIPRRSGSFAHRASAARRCSPDSFAKTPRARCSCRGVRPGERTPLWIQRLKSRSSCSRPASYPSSRSSSRPTEPACSDVFDMPALIKLLGGVRRREIAAAAVRDPTPSPFARWLMFAYVGANLRGDTPLAERKRAGAVPRSAAVARAARRGGAARAARRRGRRRARAGAAAAGRRAAPATPTATVLRRVGNLTTADEPRASPEVPHRRQRRGPAGRAVARAPRHRAAHRPHAGSRSRTRRLPRRAGRRAARGRARRVPRAASAPLETLLHRYARPQAVSAARRSANELRASRASSNPCCAAWRAPTPCSRARLGTGSEWCDPRCCGESSAAPSPCCAIRCQRANADETLARFLPVWHGIGQGGRGLTRLQEVLVARGSCRCW